MGDGGHAAAERRAPDAESWFGSGSHLDRMRNNGEQFGRDREWEEDLFGPCPEPHIDRAESRYLCGKSIALLSEQLHRGRGRKSLGDGVAPECDANFD